MGNVWPTAHTVWVNAWGNWPYSMAYCMGTVHTVTHTVWEVAHTCTVWVNVWVPCPCIQYNGLRLPIQYG